VFAGNALIGLTVTGGEKQSAKQLLDNYNVIVPNGDYLTEEITPVSQDLLENDLNDTIGNAQCPAIP
jgi:hypothetical protein